MRSPEVILKNLGDKAKDKSYQFKRLYRNLYNPEMYLLAYQKIASSEGSMTAGTDGNTLDGISMARVNRIIASLKDHSYQPQPAKRKYIAKKNSRKKRPLGIPSTDDKLVQEVVRVMLEAIYEPGFSVHSHGFRPNRSCHTCLTEVKRTFTGVKWFVEGDIKGCFDNIDHHILISIVRRRITDESFIELLWKFLRAGYLENWEYNTTYSGTPQGSGVSPILANIYLSELDAFVEKLKSEYDRQDSYRKPQKEYSQTLALAHYWEKKRKTAVEQGDEAEVQRAKGRVDELYAKLRSIPCFPAIDPTFKKIQYVRYADDFIIGVIGPKADAEIIKGELRAFLHDKLNLTLSEEKTKITHSAELVRFLGYDLTVSRSQDYSRDKNGNLKRHWNGQVKLYLPHEKWFNKLLEYRAMYIKKCPDGKEIWKPTYRGKLINMPDAQIVSKFNSEIRGLYNYYRLAVNVSVLNSFYRIMRGSLFKTFGCKYRTTYKHIKVKYVRNGIPLWIVAILGRLGVVVITFVLILTVYGRFFKIFTYIAIAPIPLSTFAGEPTQNVGRSFLKSFAGACLQGAIIVVACVIFSLYATSQPSVDAGASALSMAWSYMEGLILNMLILTATVKASDHVVREMMGL